MKYLEFSILNKNYLLFLSYFIVVLIREIINDFYSSTKDIIESFHKYYTYSLSDFLSIIAIIIIKIRSKGIKKNNNAEKINHNNSIKYIYYNPEYENIKKIIRIFIIIIFISLFDFLAQYSNVIFNIIQKKTDSVINKINLNSVLIINVITKYIFSRLILYTPFYKHHYLCFLINLILLIALGIIDIIQINNNNNNSLMAFFYIAMKILSVTLYSIEDVLAKVIFEFYSISPYILLLYRAIFVCFIAILFSIPFIFIELPDENGKNSCVFTRIWKIYDNKLNILTIIGMLIIQFIYNINIFFIFVKFSPSHMAMASVIGSFGSLLNSIIIFKNVELLEFFIRFILYFLLIISTSIYNEIIILKCFGLHKHTKSIMEKEANMDYIKNIKPNQSIDENITFSENDEQESISIVI